MDIDDVALKIATKLRHGSCPHGIPDVVTVWGKIPPWGEGATCKPLCDACVLAVVREVLAEQGVSSTV